MPKNQWDRRTITQQDENDIIKTYQEIGGILKVRKMFGIGEKKMYQILKKYNIVTEKRKHRKYELIDPNFLKNIDEEWKSYYLGFFYADGCIYRNRMELSITDRDILDQMNRKIYVNKPLINRLSYNDNPRLLPVYKLEICSWPLNKRMREIGLFEKKSLVIDFPEEMVDSKFLKDFVRGYFDGDGCIHRGNNKNRTKQTYKISLCVSDLFGKKLQEIFLKMNIDSKLRTIKNTKILDLVILKQKSIFNFYNWIFGHNPEFFLERKKIIFDRFIKEHPIIKEYKNCRSYRVQYDKHHKKWIPTIYDYINKKDIYLGRYNTEFEGYCARMEYLKNHNITDLRHYGRA